MLGMHLSCKWNLALLHVAYIIKLPSWTNSPNYILPNTIYNITFKGDNLLQIFVKCKCFTFKFSLTQKISIKDIILLYYCSEPAVFWLFICQYKIHLRQLLCMEHGVKVPILLCTWHFSKSCIKNLLDPSFL